ncbi:RBBP9/YdeN family alpha/beta hydrolase [Variovorax sp. M-6]|uniref:RBBP9/YdeN family alpha/beta hydrolase n=1 Tax=Variovorax sp. M-6 TaxID=3233041 RepID=UPI003F983822
MSPARPPEGSSAGMRPTVVVVPGLRDEAPGHWQTLLAQALDPVVVLPALGRRNIDLAARVEAIESAVCAIAGPVIVVAHSGGAVATVHWAQRTQAKVLGALLATPPVFSEPLGPEYPDMAEFEKQGWLPLPVAPLPFRTFVAASRNDPLGSYDEVSTLARHWGAELVDLGEVGHLNPASGFGPWPRARALIEQLAG